MAPVDQGERGTGEESVKNCFQKNFSRNIDIFSNDTYNTNNRQDTAV